MFLMPGSNYAYGKKWRLDRDRGVLRLVDAAPATEHVALLLAAGWSLRAVADGAGVSPTVVLKLKQRKQRKITPGVARKVLAVTPGGLATRNMASGFVIKTGAVRRIEALLAIGHRHCDITAAMQAACAEGTNPRSVMVLHQKGAWINRVTRDAVCAAYEQLSMTPGTSDKTRRLAAKYGYAPPLAWDESAIDDPNGRPALDEDHATDETVEDLDEVAVARTMAGTLRLVPRVGAHGGTPPELVEAIRRLAAAGWTDQELADRLGMTKGAVLKQRERNGISAGTRSGRSERNAREQIVAIAPDARPVTEGGRPARSDGMPAA